MDPVVVYATRCIQNGLESLGLMMKMNENDIIE
jgi:hypothetical protein